MEFYSFAFASLPSHEINVLCLPFRLKDQHNTFPSLYLKKPLPIRAEVLTSLPTRPGAAHHTARHLLPPAYTFKCPSC